MADRIEIPVFSPDYILQKSQSSESWKLCPETTQILEKYRALTPQDFNSQFESLLAELNDSTDSTTLRQIRKHFRDRGKIEVLKRDLSDYLKFDHLEWDNIISVMEDWFHENYSFKAPRDEKDTECFMFLDGIYLKRVFTFVDEVCLNVLGKDYSNRRTNSVIDRIKARTYINWEDFCEKNIDLIPLENGILNIKTKELMPFSPDHYFFGKLPVKYDPIAKCPKIMKFFEEVLPHEEDRAFLQEIFGYCLLRDYPISKFFVLSGEGSNGKSVTLKLLHRLLGPENVTNTSLYQLSEDRFALADLRDKLANINADLPEGVIRDTSKLKQLTGGDRLDADRKFLSRIRFVNYAKLIFSTNVMPRFHEDSQGFNKRWSLIEFNERFLSEKDLKDLPEEDRKGVKVANPNLGHELNTPEEISGLLNWALEGLERLLKQGDFSDAKSQAQTMRIIKLRGFPEAIFCEDCLEENEEEFTLKADIRKAFVEWCKENRVKPTINDKRLSEAMSLLPFQVYSIKKRVPILQKGSENGTENIPMWVWIGCKLKKCSIRTNVPAGSTPVKQTQLLLPRIEVPGTVVHLEQGV